VIDRRQVLLVNGRNRPLARPKKKNVAHLQRYDRRADIEEAARSGKLTDSLVIKYLKELVPQKGNGRGLVHDEKEGYH
ncbi:MAG TPA: hypothetical protein PLC75_03640, partial [Bacillota bacterium]|nr:hypothetical protein [Bacillota bacterium]